MITAALLEAAARVLASLFALVPDVALDVDDFGNVGTMLGSSAFGFNDYFPVTALFGAVALLLTVWFSMAAWNAIVWVYHQFWGSS